MKFWYIGKGKSMKIFNTDAMRKRLMDVGTYVHDKYAVFNHHISSGSANSLITMGIIAVCVFMTFTAISNNDVVVAQARVEVAKEEAKRDIEIAKVHAEGMRVVAKYQAQAEEARASMNPYVAAATHGSTPVNVYIDTSDSRYVIETSDGATEIAISTITVRGKKYSSEQSKLMRMAYHIGKEVGFPETVQSFLLQETLAGAYGDRIGDTNLPMGKRSYGVMQMKVATTRKVLRKYPGFVTKYFPTRKKLKRIRDEEIIIKLIQDDEFNIRMASFNYAMHRKASKSWAQSVVAYNTGQGRANKISEPKKHVYFIKIVKRLIKEVRPFNKEAKLSI